jgi:oxalate decarboxylase/phosphoglucose isomerase-like protein (cupin superfamily)
MGRGGAITRIPQLSATLRNIAALKRVRVAFAEGSPEVPISDPLPDPPGKDGERQWDTNYRRNYQHPHSSTPNHPGNTVQVNSYLLDFQRAYFKDARKIAPVRYENALMDEGDPERRPGNIVDMKWILQEELGGSVVFFHEVTVGPGVIEGTHQHVGSEECYYVVSGEGVAYMAAGDDPETDQYELVDHAIYGQPARPCRKIPVRQGHVIYAKSGGVHGIHNTGTEPLKFVSFLYHTS